MLKKLQKNNKGFTIIEVMIVLAIAGLILLIVFLAVPALQRNSRNTQRKNDAGAIAGALATFTSNNNGKLPTGLGSSTTDLEICAAAGAAQAGITACTATRGIETAKLGYYTPDHIWTSASAVGTTVNYTPSTVTYPGNGTAIDKDSVVVRRTASCNTATQGSVIYTPRSTAVVYVTENTGNGTVQCVDQ